MVSTKLKQHLEDAGVSYASHPHPSVYTAQETAQSIHIAGREMMKSVILKADEGKLIMAVLSAKDLADLDVLREEIGCHKLRLASETEFADAFPTCEQGGMPPFGNIFNLTTYCDTKLSRNREIEFNAGSHDETIRMQFEDYKRLVKPKIIDFAQPYESGEKRMAA
jgi:Ala-tRNA(Pro) deacylase